MQGNYTVTSDRCHGSRTASILRVEVRSVRAVAEDSVKSVLEILFLGPWQQLAMRIGHREFDD